MSRRKPAQSRPGAPDPAAAAVDPERVGPSAEAFTAAQQSEEFVALRRKFRGFAFPMFVAFLVWYFGYVLLSTYAVDLMSTPVFGNLNVGLLFGLGQFVTTFLITWLYIRHANKSLDPVAAKMRQQLEGDF